MGVVSGMIAAVIKSAVGSCVENKLANQLISYPVDVFTGMGVARVADFIARKKSEIESVLSAKNMRSMKIPAENADYVAAEIKKFLSETDITQDVLRECGYSGGKLGAYLWEEYCRFHAHPECGPDICKGLNAVAEVLTELEKESSSFERDLLIETRNYAGDIEKELRAISAYLQDVQERTGKNEQTAGARNAGDRTAAEELLQNGGNQRAIRSRMQEYAQKWNSNMFLNDFDRRDENAGVNIKLGDIYTDDLLPHYIWKDNNGISTDLKNLLSELDSSPAENKLLLVLGQPGIGKSTLVTWMSVHFARRADEILVYRFAGDLKNAGSESRNRRNVDFVEVFLRELGIEQSDLSGKIMILDGFDELKAGNKREVILNQLYWRLIKESDLHHFILIITCRENYLQGLRAIGCDYITLQPWDSEQIRSFYTVYQQKTGGSLSEDTLRGILRKESILGVPLLLYMVLALKIRIENDRSMVDIYDQIFSLQGGIYDRCIRDSRYGSSHRIHEIKEQIHQISREIAVWMFENNPEEALIPHEEYVKICKHRQDFLIGNYFKRVSHCDGVNAGQLYFVHRSIYEYFVAEYIFTSIYDNKNSTEALAGALGRLLKGNRLSKEIRGFLAYKIQNSALRTMAAEINDAFQLMLRDGMTYYTKQYFKNVIVCEMNVFYNMLDIIHMWEHNRYSFDESVCKYLSCGRSYKADLTYAGLSGINLGGADLSNADLSGADLTRANLTYADLRNTKLYNAVLLDAILNEANLTEARFAGAYLEGAELEDACLRGTVFSAEQIRDLQELYDIGGGRVVSHKTAAQMEDLTSVSAPARGFLTQEEIDLLLGSLASEPAE